MKACTNTVAFTPYREDLRRFILRMAGDTDNADDLTQETLLRAERKKTSFREQASPRTWLFAIAINTCRDHFRAEARRTRRSADFDPGERLPADVDLESAFAKAEMSACISGYLFRLPKQQREVVALHDMGGLDHPEISRLLKISQANSRVILHRGRDALRTLLQEHCVLAFDDSVPCEPKRGPCADS